MRLLIGSDHPRYLGRQADVRAWAERILWFVEQGDVVVLKDAPDPGYLRHICGLLNVEVDSLRLVIAPHRHLTGNFDGWSLLDPGFQLILADVAAGVNEVITLWPSAEVGWLVENLGIADRLSGAAFLKNGGGALANGKVTFRAIASAVGAPIPRGGVCHSMEDAFQVSGHLLRNRQAVMVKRNHGGGGSGNAILLPEAMATSHSGHAAVEIVLPAPDDLRKYWQRRWDWASVNGAHPVVVEAFVPDARTLYFEVVCESGQDACGVIGELIFDEGKIVKEVIPAPNVAVEVRDSLQHWGNRLTAAYASIGYRGRLSLDAVATQKGEVYFTEANARFTGSTHLYASILPRLALSQGAGDRIVLQTTSPPEWQLTDIAAFMEDLRRHGLAFEAGRRRGIVPVTPVVHGTGQAVLATVGEDLAAAETINRQAASLVGARRDPIS